MLPGVGRIGRGSTPNKGVGAIGPAYQAQFSSYRFSNGQRRALVEVVSAVSAEGYALNLANNYVSFPANTPRVTDRGLLCEAGATNLLTYSATPTDAAWTLTSAGATAGQADPAFGSAAHLIAEVGTSGVVRRTNTVAVTSAAAYVIGMILKRSNCDWVRFGVARETGLTNQSRAWFNLNTGAVGTRNDSGTGCGGTSAGIIALADGWYYCYLAFTAPTTAVVPFIISATADASTTRVNNGAYYIWNTQLQTGSAPSSPIITTSAAVARADDANTLILGARTMTLSVTYDDDATATLSDKTGNLLLATGTKYIKSIISTDTAAVIWPDPKFLVGDGVTDNSGGLLALLRYAKSGTPYTLPAGTFAMASAVSLLEHNLPAIYINGPASGVADFVWSTSPSATPNLQIGSQDGTAERVEIVGGMDYSDCHIKLRVGRAAVRTANSDLLRLPGVLNYKVEGVAVPRADNMAISFRQFSPHSFQPLTGYVRYCDVGELPVAAETLGDYGSIGDSGIWSAGAPPLTGEWAYNRVRGTGDDAIFIGHTTLTDAVTFSVNNNYIENCSAGIGTSHAGGIEIADNFIKRTRNAGIRAEVDSELGAPTIGHNVVSRDNIVEEAGFLTATDIGATTLLAQVNAFPFWFRGDDCTSTDDILRRSKGRALVLQPPPALTMDGFTATGFTIEDAGCSDATGTLAAWAAAGGVIHRSASTSGTLTNVSVAGTIARTNQSLLEILPIGTSVDSNIDVDLSVSGLGLGSNPAVRVVAATDGVSDLARANPVTADIAITDASVIATPKFVTGGTTNTSDVTVNIT